jgi:hypothetical protein
MVKRAFFQQIVDQKELNRRTLTKGNLNPVRLVDDWYTNCSWTVARNIFIERPRRPWRVCFSISKYLLSFPICLSSWKNHFISFNIFVVAARLLHDVSWLRWVLSLTRHWNHIYQGFYCLLLLNLDWYRMILNKSCNEQIYFQFSIVSFSFKLRIIFFWEWSRKREIRNRMLDL